jgi:hypothetical protein
MANHYFNLPTKLERIAAIEVMGNFASGHQRRSRAKGQWLPVTLD